MQRGFVRIGLAQTNAKVGDLNANSEKIIGYIEKAHRCGVDIVVFPETSTCGYPPEDLLLKEHFVNDNLKALNVIIKNTAGITAIVGFVDKDKNKNLYNAAAIIHNCRLTGVYHKMRLPNYGVFDERRYFKPGEENAIYKLGGLLFGVSICEDIWQDDGPHIAQAEAGARLLINLSASPYHTGKNLERERLLSWRARKTNSFICYTNLIGGQDELVFDGGSIIVNQKGRVIASGKNFEEDFVLADLPIGLLVPSSQRRKKIRKLTLRVISKEFQPSNRPSIPKHISRRLSDLAELYSALALGTKDYMKKNGFEKAVIGLSGGIDSSLTAAIAVDAIGKENIIGVSMPSHYSSEETKSDARTVAENLGIKFIVVPIDAIFNIYMIMLEKDFFGLSRDITEENLQARIRGNILMALSNKFGWFVLATGNKSEIATGYCTLYGDMAGGFAVIKDVPKTLVYKLARLRNNKGPTKIIPDTVFERAPMAELKYNQKDSDTLPPYDILDPLLKEYIEENKSFGQIVGKGRDESVVKKVIAMVDKSEYKRRQAPPGVKITPRAFGKDRRLPITNGYKEY